MVNPSKDTIYKAFLGHKFLEIYKRFSDKMELLDSALETSDGNIIINVNCYSDNFDAFNNIIVSGHSLFEIYTLYQYILSATFKEEISCKTLCKLSYYDQSVSGIV